jgi:hypothetical protein
MDHWLASVTVVVVCLADDDDAWLCEQAWTYKKNGAAIAPQWVGSCSDG